MAEVLPRDVLLRIGATPHGVVVVGGARRATGRFAPGYTHTRADETTCATSVGRDGLVHLAAANKLRVEWVDLDGDGIRETPGMLLEGSRANVVLWNRDLTNAAWVKSGGGGVTAAKDQTGIDGVASSASRITATGANGTCLQSITLASSQRMQTVWIKRLVGSGGIDMTTDNGSTWTPVTATTSWARVKIPAQTLANPTVGFRIQTNTDSVAIDGVQNETGAFESSTIFTTSAAVTRAADSLTAPFNFGPLPMTLFSDFKEMGNLLDNGADGPRILFLGDASTPAMWLQAANNLRYRINHHNGVTQVSRDAQGDPAFGNRLRIVSQLTNNGSVGILQSINGAPYTDGGLSSVAAIAAKWFSQTIRIGGQGSTPAHVLMFDLQVFRGVRTPAECEAIL